MSLHKQTTLEHYGVLVGNELGSAKDMQSYPG